MIVYNMPQRSPEWYKIRSGIITASAARNVLTPSLRNEYMYKLISEILTGQSEVIETNQHMQWGIEYEEEARQWYIEKTGNQVEEIGFAISDFNAGIGCSPDGLVGDGGLIEIKCPMSKTHIKYVMTGPKTEYVQQMQFQMLVTGRKWCDFVTYDPRMPESAKGAIHRIDRDEQMLWKMVSCLTKMQKTMKEFLAEHGVEYNY